jgi:hypothetical protein
MEISISRLPSSVNPEEEYHKEAILTNFALPYLYTNIAFAQNPKQAKEVTFMPKDLPMT